MMNKLYYKICEARLLEVHVGLLGAHLWCKMFASYGTSIFLFSVATVIRHMPNVRSITPISFDIIHHVYRMDNVYPVITTKLTVFNWVIFDTCKAAHDELARRSAVGRAKWDAEQRRKEIIVAKAPEIIKAAISECKPVAVEGYWRSDAVELLENISAYEEE